MYLFSVYFKLFIAPDFSRVFQEFLIILGFSHICISKNKRNFENVAKAIVTVLFLSPSWLKPTEINNFLYTKQVQ